MGELLLLKTTKWRIQILFTFYTVCGLAVCAHEQSHNEKVTHSILEIRYNNSKTGELVVDTGEYGHYGTQSRHAGESGILVHVQSVCKQPEGCGPGWAGCAPIEPKLVPQKKWIALIRRGNCSFNQKIHYATKVSNASAVVLYNNQSLQQGDQVYIPQTQGSYNGKLERGSNTAALDSLNSFVVGLIGS